jgi:hypothetical protein
MIYIFTGICDINIIAKANKREKLRHNFQVASKSLNQAAKNLDGIVFKCFG